MNFNRLVVRCDAGIKYGLGHLSRCLTLSSVFDVSECVFLIKTDSPKRIQSFFLELDVCFRLVAEDMSCEQELLLLSKLVDNDTLLLLDHYYIDDVYQLYLKSRGIRWLQFDSHAKINVYANWLLHGSVGATEMLYAPLVKSEDVQLLVGASYAIIKKEVRMLRQSVVPRKMLGSMIICFGGGNDFGLTKQVLQAMSKHVISLSAVKISVSVNGSEEYVHEIMALGSQFYNFERISHEELSTSMAKSDLSVVAPGMISYEAACLGLPMLLIATADNQAINARGWVKSGCAMYLGRSDSLVLDEVWDALELLMLKPSKLTDMSQKGLSCIDGQGVYRVKKQVLGAST